MVVLTCDGILVMLSYLILKVFGLAIQVPFDAFQLAHLRFFLLHLRDAAAVSHGTRTGVLASHNIRC